MKFAFENNRTIPQRDKIFELNNRAKEMILQLGKENVINGTIGALLTDEGELAIMEGVLSEIRKLSAEDFAEYAPIGGTGEFKQAVLKAAFCDTVIGMEREVVATPGGTGAIKNAMVNYTMSGEYVLTSDWYWAPYKSICEEHGRKLLTYELFDENGNFNLEDFEKQVLNIGQRQRNILILINTPAHNPTGYEISTKEWLEIINIINQEKLRENKIVLFIDVAYIDFAGEPDKVREFLPMLNECNENVLSIIGYSASKTFAMYGMRTGAMIGLHKEREVVEEFRRVCEFSSRNSWSNCNRSGQQVIANIYKNAESIAKIDCERKKFRDMLLGRGRAFEEEARKANLKIVPFVSGFFICLECAEPEDISEKLAERGIFVVPLAKGIRISIASISEEECRTVVKALKEVI